MELLKKRHNWELEECPKGKKSIWCKEIYQEEENITPKGEKFKWLYSQKGILYTQDGVLQLIT